jgi:hypothetical protein
MLGERPIAAIAKETGLTRQTIYRIRDDAAGAMAILVAWEQRAEKKLRWGGTAARLRPDPAMGT